MAGEKSSVSPGNGGTDNGKIENSARGYTEGSETANPVAVTLQIVYVNAYRNHFGEVRFTKGYQTVEEATSMKYTNRGKSVRYINRVPIRIILPA